MTGRSRTLSPPSDKAKWAGNPEEQFVAWRARFLPGDHCERAAITMRLRPRPWAFPHWSAGAGSERARRFRERSEYKYLKRYCTRLQRLPMRAFISCWDTPAPPDELLYRAPACPSDPNHSEGNVLRHPGDEIGVAVGVVQRLLRRHLMRHLSGFCRACVPHASVQRVGL